MSDDLLSFTTAQARKNAEAQAAGGTAVTYIPFDLDGERYQAAAVPPGGALLDAAAMAAADGAERLRLVAGFLDAVLLRGDGILADPLANPPIKAVGSSAERFAARLRDPDNPIDLPTAAQVVAKLMEKYSGRPTEPSSPSAVG